MMNDKIKELAEKCGFRSNPNIYDRNQSFDIEKFAELIVRECAGLLEKEMEKYHDEGTPTYNLLMQESVWMKKHFGVE